MSYLKIDPILNKWAEDKLFHIYTSHLGYDVRCIDIVSPAGRRFQLWIDEPNDDGRTTIHIWDMKKKKMTYSAELNNFLNRLNESYQELVSWF